MHQRSSLHIAQNEPKTTPRQLILVEISGKSVGNHHGTVYCIANILGTTTIDDSLLGTEDTPFILLRIILE